MGEQSCCFASQTYYLFDVPVAVAVAVCFILLIHKLEELQLNLAWKIAHSLVLLYSQPVM